MGTSSTLNSDVAEASQEVEKEDKNHGGKGTSNRRRQSWKRKKVLMMSEQKKPKGF